MPDSPFWVLRNIYQYTEDLAEKERGLTLTS